MDDKKLYEDYQKLFSNTHSFSESVSILADTHSLPFNDMAKILEICEHRIYPEKTDVPD